MAREATDNAGERGGVLAQRKPEVLERTHEGFRFRLRLGKLGRHRITIRTQSETSAEKRRDEITDLARTLATAGHAEQALAMAKKAGASPDAETIRELRSIAEGLCNGKLPKRSAEGPKLTFRQVATKWTSGDLHRSHPDHVKDKDHTDDEARLEYLCGLDMGGVKLGALAIDRVTLDHAERAMAQLPETARRPSTRRHYAQVLHRVFSLAVYPLRLIAASPLPRGFMPKAGKPPAFSYLYPSDDAALMACTDVPLHDRVLFGFLDREGPRAGEAASLPISAFDLERGAVRLDENKTDDPRTWALDPGVVQALRVYLEGCRAGAPASALMFVDADGTAYDPSKLADRLRSALRRAKVHETRPELFDSTETRSRLRAHDLRGTFVTLSLANGRTETWVADRTGHKSSAMINRYRRAARSANELGLGPLLPLDQAIPEFRGEKAVVGGPEGGPEPRKDTRQSEAKQLDSHSKAEVAEWQTRRIQKPRSPRTGDATAEKAPLRAPTDGTTSTAAHPDEQVGLARAEADPVETALAEALTKASAAGQWEIVARLAGELEARRKARAGVVDLDAARARRGVKP